jgi:hypothetical protein
VQYTKINAGKNLPESDFRKFVYRRLRLIAGYTDKPVEIIRNPSVNNVRGCGTSLKQGLDSNDNRWISLNEWSSTFEFTINTTDPCTLVLANIYQIIIRSLYGSLHK